MLISDLKNNIVKNQLGNLYIFTGEEEGIMNIYIKNIAKKLNLTTKRVDSIEEVHKHLNLKSLVKVKYLYLVRQDKAIKSQETAWEFLKNKIVGNYIILIEPNLDTRTKFAKYFEDCTIKFDKLSTDLLVNYGKKKGTTLSDINLQTLADWCGNSYLRFMNELDKIMTISKTKNITDTASMVMLETDGGIYKEREFEVFDYVDSILARNISKCFDDLEYVKSQNCEILIVSLLTTAFKNMLLYLNDCGGKGVCDRTGLTGWQVQQTMKFCQNYTAQEAENNMLFMQATEMKLKTGVLDTSIALDYILAEVL